MMRSVRSLLDKIETQRLAVLPDSVEETVLPTIQESKNDDLGFLRDQPTKTGSDPFDDMFAGMGNPKP
jgi:hypothetical protein